jgi:branched-chain amino acid transport system substrate-binding protein
MRRPGMKAVGTAVTAALVGTLAVAAAAYGRPAATAGPAAAAGANAATAINCKRPTIGFLAPLTGDAASIGQETRNWARYAVLGFNNTNKTIKAQLAIGDTRLPDTAQARLAAQRLASNSRVAAVVGPAGSQEVIASAPIMSRAGLIMISGSATRTSLTQGADRLANFFRVVPNDGVQGPTIARFLRTNLSARRVMVVDDQTAYGQPLANSIAANLRAGGVTVDRESANTADVSDFSALVSKVGSDTQFVVLAWQLAAKANIFAQQLREQGKTARIFGSDGLYQPSEFKVNGSYVASFAPDIRTIAAKRALVTGFNRRYGTNWGTFGPPAYLATQVALNATKNACKDGKATRSEVNLWIRRTQIKNSILGNTLQFDARGDVRGAKFYIFNIRNGQYVTVG